MIAVIIAGGSGTRLWPISTPTYPKHLLKVSGQDRSLLQQTYDRAKRLTDKMYVVSEAGHIQHVREQLPDLPEDAFVVEPARRGTANCILAALVQIRQQHDPSEPIAFLHADHYVRDNAGFMQSFRIATKISKQTGHIVLIGIEPNKPAVGFGYIQKGGLLDAELFVYTVDSFTEKPDFKTAQRYLRSGNYLWNAGYFVGSLQTFETAMRQAAPDLSASYEALVTADPAMYEQTYLNLESETIDYALIEKVEDLLVVPAGFDWMDLGSFADLSKVVEANESGNHVEGVVELEDVKNSYIQNYEDKPMAVIGIDNCVVINTPDGLLITRKDLSQKVGAISKKFQ